MSDKCSAIIGRLIEQRHKKGMTQKDLAVACSYTQSVIGRLESGKVEPKISTLLRVAEALGYTIEIVPDIK